MNFAPYQSSPPESTRALSPPPPRSTTTSPPNSKPALPTDLQRAQSSIEDPWAAARSSALPSPSAFVERGYDDLEAGQGQQQQERGWGVAEARAGGFVGQSDGAYVFETSLGIRMEVEAALAYLLVPPVGGVALLVFEHKSDYVRFHAWQSSLVFSAAFVLHLLFSWSSFLSWVLFLADLVLVGWLVFRAYKDDSNYPSSGKWPVASSIKSRRSESTTPLVAPLDSSFMT